MSKPLEMLIVWG